MPPGLISLRLMFERSKLKSLRDVSFPTVFRRPNTQHFHINHAVNLLYTFCDKMIIDMSYGLWICCHVVMKLLQKSYPC